MFVQIKRLMDQWSQFKIDGMGTVFSILVLSRDQPSRFLGSGGDMFYDLGMEHFMTNILDTDILLLSQCPVPV